MYKRIALLFLFLLPSLAKAQTSSPLVASTLSTGNITAASTACQATNSCVFIHLPNNAIGASFTTSGTYVGTVQFEESGDNQTTWPINGGNQSAPGTTTITINGLTDLRIRASAYVSGTIVGTISVTVSSGLTGPVGPAGPGGTNAFGPSFSIGGGTAQAQTVSPTTPITNATLVNGYQICWAPAASNTGAAPTLAGAGTSTFSAHAIFKGGGLFNLIASDILFGAISCAIWDGTAFELQNPLAGLAASASLTLGGGAAAAGATATGGFAASEATNTGWTPTAGQDYIRADLTHSWLTSVNGAAEVPMAWWSATPAGNLCAKSSGTLGMLVEAACGATTVPVSGLTAATGPNTTANGNNPQTLNWAQTTDSQAGIAFGETSAATGGTITTGLANQGLVAISTAAGSTSTPFKVTQGAVTGVLPFPAVQWQTTWNNAGLTGQGLFFNVTDTASASGSMLFNFQKNNAALFQLRKDGRLLVTVPGSDAVISSLANSLRLTAEGSNQFVQTNIGFAYNTKQTIASSATPAFNLSAGNVFSNTLTANVTGATVNNLRDSQAEFFELCQDGTGGRSFVWPTTMKDPPLTHLDASVCKVYPFVYDGTSLFYTGGESTESNVTPVTVNANVATDQLLQAIPIPSNSLNVVGHTLNIWTAGVYTTTAANTSTITIKAKLCTVSGCGSGTVITLATFASTSNAGGQTNDPFSMQLFSTTQTGGASSVFEAHGNLTVDLTAAVASQVFGDANTAVTSAIDTTGPLFLQITAAFSVASGSNSFTGRQLQARLN